MLAVIEAVIFDMDGLLIDSEPVWREVEIEIFKPLGVPLDNERAKETMGLRTDEVVRYWHHRYPWRAPSQQVVTQHINQNMVNELSKRNIGLPGVHEALKVVESAGLPMAIASSSPLALIKAAIRGLNIAARLQVIQSAEHEPYGKPHPGVFIKTANKLGVAPEHCLAFEDSPNGVLAAKAAKMKCIAIPEAAMRSNPVYHIADKVLGSLLEFDAKMLQEFIGHRPKA